MTFPFKPVSENATAAHTSRRRSPVNSGLFLFQPAEDWCVCEARFTEGHLRQLENTHNSTSLESTCVRWGLGEAVHSVHRTLEGRLTTF